MTEDEKRTIETFARQGALFDQRDILREKSVAIFRQYLRHTPKKDWGPHMKFMSEIDSPCPDYGLRRLYRDQLKALADVSAPGECGCPYML